MFVLQVEFHKLMAAGVSIYAFRELGSPEVRYVGQAINLTTRLNKHKNENSLVSKWIKELWRQGKSVLVELLQIVPATDANRVEAEYIAFYYTQGHRLWNQQHVAPLERQRRAAEEKARSEKESAQLLKEIEEMLEQIRSGGSPEE